MKYIGLAHTLKLEINKMTYEEKIAFCKEHLGEEMEFRKEVGGHWFTRILSGCNDVEFYTASRHNGWVDCRPIPKKKLIPWTLETAESVQLRHKNSGIKVWMNYGLMIAWFHDGQFNNTTTYGRILADWETIDGKPCGTEVTE
jgi:hypothetical protein